MKKSSFLSEICKIGTEPVILIVTTFTTVLFGILVNLFDQASPLYQICDRGFYISLSLILVQLMLQQTNIIENTDDIKTKLSSYDNVIFNDEKSKVNDLFEVQLKNPLSRRIKIICYGTNTYGKYIEYIISKCEFIRTLDIVICSPNTNMISANELDSKKIENALKEISETLDEYNKRQKHGRKKSVNIYCSEIPPTIRASLIYNDKKKPIWCTMQFYHLYFGDGPLLRGDGLTPAIVASDNYSPIIEKLALSFEEEFERLKKGTINEFLLK